MSRAVCLSTLSVCLALLGGEPGLPAGVVEAAAADSTAPRLVLLIVVDQLGSAELDRIRPFLGGGLLRLEQNGVSFRRARHGHAVTETAPGHATLVTGCHPSHHGIISNWWVEGGNPKLTSSVDDAEDDESPRRLLVSTLGDWIKQRYPGSKVVAASPKDRSAIFLGGHNADVALWYDEETGHFKTSSYYREPAWLETFNNQRLLDRYFGRSWEPLPISAEQLRVFGTEALDLGPLRPGFPHVFGGPRPAPTEDFYKELVDSPALDGYLAELARLAIETEDLGADHQPDLLALGFSALDAVGHRWGPQSREYLDAALRLDRTLGELLELVDRRVGLEHVIIGLSSDHGVAPVPELRQHSGLPAERADAETTLCLQRAAKRLAERYGVESWLIPGPALAPGLSEKTGLGKEKLEAVTESLLEDCPSVAAVWTRSELLGEGPSEVLERQLFINSFHPERSPDFTIQFEPFFMWSARHLTSHGTGYPYDTAVPMLFAAPGLEPGTVDAPAQTVDFAPTLASLIGIPPPAGLDGTDLGLQLPTAKRTSEEPVVDDLRWRGTLPE